MLFGALPVVLGPDPPLTLGPAVDAGPFAIVETIAAFETLPAPALCVVVVLGAALEELFPPAAALPVCVVPASAAVGAEVELVEPVPGTEPADELPAALDPVLVPVVLVLVPVVLVLVLVPVVLVLEPVVLVLVPAVLVLVPVVLVLEPVVLVLEPVVLVLVPVVLVLEPVVLVLEPVVLVLVLVVLVLAPVMLEVTPVLLVLEPVVLVLDPDPAVTDAAVVPVVPDVGAGWATAASVPVAASAEVAVALQQSTASRAPSMPRADVRKRWRCPDDRLLCAPVLNERPSPKKEVPSWTLITPRRS